jgi:signal transduction histidine kinase
MKFKLSTKTLFILAVIIIIAMVTAMVSLGYVWKMRQTMEDSLSQNAMEMLAAAELDISLLKQREIIYLQVLTPEGLKGESENDKLEEIFRTSLERFKKSTNDPDEKVLLNELEAAFNRFDALRDTILSMYRKGNDLVKARELALNDLDTLYHECSKRCDALIASNKRDITRALRQGEGTFRQFKEVVIASIFLIGLLGTGLIWLLFRTVFVPLRQMTKVMEGLSTGDRLATNADHEDDLEMLMSGLQMFMAEAAEIRSDLEHNRHELSQSRRLAAIGNIVAQVAHEIKNRLVMLGGFALSIEKGAHDAGKVRNKAAIISREVVKLEKMLKGITEFSKSIHLELETCSLNAFLQELMPRLTEFTPQGIAIKLMLHPQALQVRMDAERVEQVIVNLVKNAVEAMQAADQGSVIMVGTSLHDQGVAITITNDGPGMDEEVQRHIFEPFFTTKRQGTGLGLAVSKKIVADHGGDMRCESSPDQGTTFTITFPRA